MYTLAVRLTVVIEKRGFVLISTVENKIVPHVERRLRVSRQQTSFNLMRSTAFCIWKGTFECVYLTQLYIYFHFCNGIRHLAPVKVIFPLDRIVSCVTTLFTPQPLLIVAWGVYLWERKWRMCQSKSQQHYSTQNCTTLHRYFHKSPDGTDGRMGMIYFK
jgi:hypothetical protein